MMHQNAMRKYCNQLERELEILSNRMLIEAKRLEKRIQNLESLDLKMATFKGYEPKFDLMSKELTVKDEILQDLKYIFGLD